MSARAHCQLNRRRRIVKADICDRHHLPVRAGDKRRQSALFFNGLKGRHAVFYSAAADCADRWCAQQETRPEDAG
jgi:hypothetical protein